MDSREIVCKKRSHNVALDRNRLKGTTIAQPLLPRGMKLYSTVSSQTLPQINHRSLAEKHREMDNVRVLVSDPTRGSTRTTSSSRLFEEIISRTIYSQQYVGASMTRQEKGRVKVHARITLMNLLRANHKTRALHNAIGRTRRVIFTIFTGAFITLLFPLLEFLARSLALPDRAKETKFLNFPRSSKPITNLFL